MSLELFDPELRASLARHLAPVQARLDELARKERSRRLALAAGSWIGALALALAVACLIDDRFDRNGETPPLIFWFLRLAQVALAFWLGYRWVVQPLSQPIAQARLAVSVEGAVGGMDHELVTALEYLQGAPPKAHAAFLEEIASKSASRSLESNWQGVLPSGRVRKGILWAVLGLAPIGLMIGWHPSWALALLARQFGFDKTIPRQARLLLPDSLMLPEAEEGIVEVGLEPFDPGGMGRVVHKGRDGTVREWTLEEAAQEGQARTLRISAEVGSGKIQAFLGSYRSEKMDLTRVSRPVLTVKSSGVELPAWVGKRADGTPWPGSADAGDLGGWNGSAATLVLESSVPLKEARLRIVHVDKSGSQETEGEAGAEKPAASSTGSTLPAAREIPLELNPEGTRLEAHFTLMEGDRLWQAEAISQDNLATRTPLRRVIDVWQPVAPRVELLPELMIPTTAGALFAGRNKGTALRHALEENEVEGIPVPLGGRFRVAYAVSSRAGLSQVRMVYRVNGATQWRTLPLPEVEGKATEGEFFRDLGVFAKTPEDAEVPFFPLSAADAMLSPGRLEGGGRFDFRIAPLKDLKPGDRIEFAIEAEDRRQPPLVGRSVTRVKDVVNLEDFLAWWSRKEREQEKLRELRLRQGKVFEGYLRGSRPAPPDR
jgi:hypothetical protein